MIYITFVAGASAFSVLNTLASVHCWHTSSRRIMLFTGGLNTAIGVIAAAAYPIDPFFANLYISVASVGAAGQFFLHGMRTPRLWSLSLPNGLFAVWVLGLFTFGLHRARWAYALRLD